MNPKKWSIFVRNLPEKLDQFGLKGVFQKVGRVWDAYIPRRKQWFKHSRFGFVRFHTRKEALDGIYRFNGAHIRGCKVFVAMAKPKERPRWKRNYISGRNQKFDQSRKVWRAKGVGQGQEKERSSDKHQTRLMRVVGQ